MLCIYTKQVKCAKNILQLFLKNQNTNYLKLTTTVHTIKHIKDTPLSRLFTPPSLLTAKVFNVF